MPAAKYPILLLHGQPGSPRDWDPVVAEIGAQAITLAVRRPGWSPGSSPTGLDGNANEAMAALDRARVDRAVVVGHSLGATVAAWLAATHPERTAAVVLVAPAANEQSLTALDHLLAVPVLGDVVSGATLAATGGALRVGRVRRAVAAQLGLDPDVLRPWAGRLVHPDVWRSFSAEQRMLIREIPQLERRLVDILAPTTIVAGTDDRIVPLKSARLLANQIRGAVLVELPGHHLLHQQFPARLAEILVRAAQG